MSTEDRAGSRGPEPRPTEAAPKRSPDEQETVFSARGSGRPTPPSGPSPTEVIPPAARGEETALFGSGLRTGGPGPNSTEVAPGRPTSEQDTALYDGATQGFTPRTGDRTAAPAPTPPTLDELGQALVDLGLVPIDELERIAAGVPADVVALSRALVRAGKLTPYQAGAVAQGKSKGLIIGRYIILDRLGAGGMGVVFKAKHRVTSRVVALKILTPSLTRNRDAVTRFRREAEAAARLNHPNVVSVLDADEDRGVHFLVLDYIEGCDLDRLVRDCGPLPIGQAIDALAQAARGLEAAHARGIVHRDIKPGNLMLDRGGAVKVLDLGLARLIDAVYHPDHKPGMTLTQAHTYMGTVDFMAPEQADDSRTADHRADIYSLGCTVFFLLTGKAPFDAPSVLKRLWEHQERPAPSLLEPRPEVPQALESLYQAMMAKRPEDRPASMAEVAARLDACRSTLAEVKEAREGLESSASAAMARSEPKPDPAAALAAINLSDGDRGLVAQPSPRATAGRDRGRRPVWIAAGAVVLAATIAAIALIPRRGPAPPPKPPDRADAVARDGAPANGPSPDPHDTRPPAPAPLKAPEPFVEVARLVCDDSRTVESVCVTPDGKIISGCANGLVQIWDPATGLEIRRLWHPNAVRPVALFPDGLRAVSGCDDGKARVWDLRTGRLIRTIPVYKGRVLTVAVSPDGRSILAGGDDPELRLFDAADGREIRRVASAPFVFSVAFTTDGKTFLAGANDGSIVVGKVEGGGPPEVLSAGAGGQRKPFGATIWTLAVADDGRHVISTSSDGQAILWDLASRREVRRAKLPDCRVRSAAIEPNGRRAILGIQFGQYTGSGALATWDLDSDALAKVGRTAPAPLGLTLLPGGGVATAGADGSVRVWAPSLALDEARRFAAEGQLDPALSRYDEAILSRPGDARLFIERGRWRAFKGSTAAADSDFTRAAELADNPQLFLDAGWWISGLYPPWGRNESPGLPADLDPSRPPNPQPTSGKAKDDGWRPVPSLGRGTVYLGATLGVLAPRSSLALTVVESASPHNVVLSMRADDWSQLWLNGERSVNTAVAPYWTQCLAEGRLKAGKNTLVASVVNEGGSHLMELRFVDDPAEFGRSQMLGGKWERAEAKFTDAIKRSPSVPDYYRDRGDAWTQIGRWRDAVADFDQARLIRPESLADQVRAASARFAAGDLPGARGLCRELAKRPGIGDDPAVARQLLSLFATIPDALEDYSGVLTMGLRLAQSKEAPLAPEVHGALLYRAGQAQGAASSLKRAIDGNKDKVTATAWTYYALALAKLRRPGAREALRRADDLASKELSALKEAVRNDRSRWVDAVALEHLLSEARAALGTAP